MASLWRTEKSIIWSMIRDCATRSLRFRKKFVVQFRINDNVFDDDFLRLLHTVKGRHKQMWDRQPLNQLIVSIESDHCMQVPVETPWRRLNLRLEERLPIDPDSSHCSILHRESESVSVTRIDLLHSIQFDEGAFRLVVY